ncbi:type II toxin-antitoxin system VapC family toxin [Rhodobium gokarnense]|uniref:Ribonuclease VapC n=1 Tax=Rhodobium gokarnense TaxID=364296 RepID=A0ABT3H817_9HYPH|nr:type II toxin-antitoxin system VapC family toxin [Rhodobium gokarnense]MCW2306530.1 putative nucleic acid-binding protein [Rhodobium gokarnense]
MILLDTNVVSELMRPAPNRQVVAFIDGHARTHFFLPAPALAELFAGVELLPDGRRKADLRGQLQRVADDLFVGRIAPFDEESARAYGLVIAERTRQGRPISVVDAEIAAIARHTGFAVATRNLGDFVGLGLALIDPFDKPA